MKILLPIFIFIFAISSFGQIRADDFQEILKFVDSVKDFSVMKRDETNRQYQERVKNFILTTKFNNKPMSETVLVFQDIKYSRGVFSADLSNRTFNDVKLQLKALESERIIILDSPGFSYPTPDISNDLRLAVYGFPIDHDLKYKTLYFMPLKYVFFNEETAEVYSAKYASNGFAKYFSDNTALPSVPTKLIQKTIAFEFVGDASTKKYYPLQCDQVAQIKADSRVYFESKSEVEADGYRPDKCTTMTQLPAPRYNQPVIGMSFTDFEKVCPMKPKYSQSRETEYGKSTGFIYKTDVANCNGMFIFRNGFLVLIEKEGDF